MRATPAKLVQTQTFDAIDVYKYHRQRQQLSRGRSREVTLLTQTEQTNYNLSLTIPSCVNTLRVHYGYKLETLNVRNVAFGRVYPLTLCGAVLLVNLTAHTERRCNLTAHTERRCNHSSTRRRRRTAASMARCH